MRRVLLTIMGLALLCGGSALDAEAQSAARPIAPVQVLPTPHRTTGAHMTGRAGQRSIKTTDTTDKPKTKQEIADEKKLERDLQICKGC